MRLSVETECPLYAVEVKMRWISVKNWEVGVGGGGGREEKMEEIRNPRQTPETKDLGLNPFSALLD